MERTRHCIVPDPETVVDDDTCNVFTSLPFSWMSSGSSIHCIYLITPHKDNYGRGLPERLGKAAKMMREVCLNQGEVFQGRIMSICFFIINF